MEGMLEPEEVEERLGEAEVKQTSRRRASAASPAASSPRARSRASANVRLVREGSGRLDRAGRLAAPLQGRRQGGRGGPRVRNRPRRLRRRQGGRRARVLRDQEGRADAGVAAITGASRGPLSRSSRSRTRRVRSLRRSACVPRPAWLSRLLAYVCLVEVQLHLNDSQEPEGEAKARPFAQGAGAEALRRLRRRDRRARHVAARDAPAVRARGRIPSCRRGRTSSSASSTPAAPTSAASSATSSASTDVRG